MAKKTKELSETELRIQNLELALVTMTNGILTINDARTRDYIVRTKYYGKIVDTKIKKDFKEAIEKKSRDSFDSVCNNILNYRFKVDTEEYTGNVLYLFIKTLEEYENKQFILDMYGKN